MQLNFAELSLEQKQLIIDRLYNKFKDRNIGLKEFSIFIDMYRQKRYDSGVISILEGDEILKGRIYGISRNVDKKESIDICLNQPLVILDDNAYKNDNNIEIEYEEKNEVEEQCLINKDLSEDEQYDLLVIKQNREKLQKLRKNCLDTDFIPNNGIIFDDNIKQVESEFTLREMNNQLPQENLLDKYNFGYVNLLDDYVEKESLGHRIKK